MSREQPLSSAAAAQLLEDLEDLVDLAAVREALAELDAGRDQPRPFVRAAVRDGSTPRRS